MVAFMAQPPILTPEQRTAALKKAAEARTARAELKEKLKMGSVTLADALAKADSDDVIGNMRVLAMLEALPGVGKVKARRLMADIEIAENRKVRGLGPKQRIALLEHLA